MKPDEIARSVRESSVVKAAGKAHDVADKVYQAVTRPDRPIEPQPAKKPWLAALLSLLVPGAGQLYNRQLAKAICLFVLTPFAGLGLLAGWLLLGWLTGFADREGWVYQSGDFLRRLGMAVPVVVGGLWLFAIIDAWQTAEALRTGRLVVRYGFRRQAVHMAAGMVPAAGALTPEETCPPEDVNKPLAGVLTEHAIRKVIRWLLKRALKVGLVLIGMPMLVIGAAFELPALVIAGAVVVLAGIVLLLRK